MEHRHNSRARVALKVILFNNGLPVAVGKTKNVSTTGLFVRSVYGDLALHQPVEIQFVPSAQRCLARIRVKAYVVHKTEAGFGIELVDANNTARDAIIKVLELESNRVELRKAQPRIPVPRSASISAYGRP
jgi:hypothetical protein